MAIIGIIGSSSLNGMGDGGGGMAARTRVAVFERRDEVGMQHEVNDWTSAAQTTQHAKERLAISFEERRNYHLGKILVAQFGPFDACINLAAGTDENGRQQTMTPEITFLADVADICVSALQKGWHVRLIDSAPLADSQVQLGRKQLYREDERKLFVRGQREIVKELAGEWGDLAIRFTPIYLDCMMLKLRLPEVFDKDKIHPATPLHAMVWEKVMRDDVLPLADSIDRTILGQRRAASQNANVSQVYAV